MSSFNLNPTNVLQRKTIVSNTKVTNANVSQIPLDNTTPQASEGIAFTPFENIIFTPKINGSKITIKATLTGSVSAANDALICTLLKNGSASLSTNHNRQPSASSNEVVQVVLCYSETSDGNARVYTINFGTHTANTAYINRASTEVFNDTCFSTLEIIETRE